MVPYCSSLHYYCTNSNDPYSALAPSLCLECRQPSIYTALRVDEDDAIDRLHCSLGPTRAQSRLRAYCVTGLHRPPHASSFMNFPSAHEAESDSFHPWVPDSNRLHLTFRLCSCPSSFGQMKTRIDAACLIWVAFSYAEVPLAYSFSATYYVCFSERWLLPPLSSHGHYLPAHLSMSKRQQRLLRTHYCQTIH